MRRFFYVLAIGFLFFAPRGAYGQPAAQPPATPPGPPPLREGTINFAFVGTSGNSSTQSIGLGGDFAYRPAPWTFTTKVAYVRNESESLLKAESFDGSFKLERAVTARLSVFGRYAFLHDEFAGIDQRHGIEGGLSYLLINVAPHTLTVDGSLGYAHESRVVGPDLSNPTAAAGTLYKLKLSDTVEVSEDARFVASLSQGDDWRVANIAAVTSKLASILSLKVSNTIRYVHTPVPGFEPTDTITAIALVAKF